MYEYCERAYLFEDDYPPDEDDSMPSAPEGIDPCEYDEKHEPSRSELAEIDQDEHMILAGMTDAEVYAWLDGLP